MTTDLIARIAAWQEKQGPTGAKEHHLLLLQAWADILRLRELAATCYAGLGAELDLPEPWLDALLAASEGKEFTVEGLLPFTRGNPDAEEGTLGFATIAAQPAAADPYVRWTDKWDCKHVLSLASAARMLSAYYDEWPGGLEEIESAMKTAAAPAQPAPEPAALTKNEFIVNEVVSVELDLPVGTRIKLAGKAPAAQAAAVPEAVARHSDPITDFQEGQWWVKELDAMVYDKGTFDQKRAVAVVHHLLRAVSNLAAPAPEPAADTRVDCEICNGDPERCDIHDCGDAHPKRGAVEIQWPAMPPGRGQSHVLFEDGYAEGWAKCLQMCKEAVGARGGTKS